MIPPEPGVRSGVRGDERFTNLRRTAAQLGVPMSWLRDQAGAGLVPHLRIGRRLLFNVEICERALMEQAEDCTAHDAVPT